MRDTWRAKNKISEEEDEKEEFFLRVFLFIYLYLGEEVIRLKAKSEYVFSRNWIFCNYFIKSQETLIDYMFLFLNNFIAVFKYFRSVKMIIFFFCIDSEQN